MNRQQHKDFLLELGTEELPPKQIVALVSSLAQTLEEQLKELSLTYDEVKTFSSPRRLAVLFLGLVSKQPDRTVELRGPSVEIAFDTNGVPTIAAKKFAATCGIELSQLKRIEDKRGTFLWHQTVAIGKKTIELLPEIIVAAIKKLSPKKPMRWEKNRGPFVRPIHWILALLDQEIIPCETFGIKSSNKTFGHRFHHPKAIIIADPNNYEKTLMEKGWVIADVKKRKLEILRQIAALTPGDVALVSENLLTQITDLVEWPVALLGTFDARFLKIPHGVLITTLENQQRCCPITDQQGALLPRFVIVANIESRAKNQVIAGNGKVVQARFTDAEYFYHNDQKQYFADNLTQLRGISFQENLGSIYDKTCRLKILTPFIATKIGAKIAAAERAAELAKCDLVTTMVREFPELQGVIGYHYAIHHENQDVASAIKEQYLPRFSQDQLPATKIGCALALADRLDSLVGFFGIKKFPSGDRDPFGLRRSATGVLRIILEKGLDLDLRELITTSCATYQKLFKDQKEQNELASKLLGFIYERLHFSYAEQKKNIGVFRAVLANLPTNLQDFTKRFSAVDEFVQLPEAVDLIEIYKRIYNILEKNKYPITLKFNPALATETAENNLALVVEQQAKEVSLLYQEKKYDELLRELIRLKPPLSNFFDKVMVITDEEMVRYNRLALLQSIRELFTLVADLSYLISGKRAATFTASGGDQSV